MTPAPESFERYHDPVAEAVRAQLVDAEKLALDAAIVFLTTRGSTGARLDASYEQDAAAMMVDALRAALVAYIVTGIEPVARVRRASAKPGQVHAQTTAFQAVQARWCTNTADALEKRLRAARGGA